jgi:hypothetical protein
MSEFVCERLSDTHDLDKFDCGNEALTRWLKNSAIRGQVQDTGRTFVWRPEMGDRHFDAGQVLGYFTLAAHTIQRSDLDDVLSRTKLRSLPTELPAILLAKLALDVRLRDRGLGGALLASALQRCVLAGELVAARFVVVDAIDDAALGFYSHYDFRRIPGTDRLVRPLRDITDELSR